MQSFVQRSTRHAKKFCKTKILFVFLFGVTTLTLQICISFYRYTVAKLYKQIYWQVISSISDNLSQFFCSFWLYPMLLYLTCVLFYILFFNGIKHFSVLFNFLEVHYAKIKNTLFQWQIWSKIFRSFCTVAYTFIQRYIDDILK